LLEFTFSTTKKSTLIKKNTFLHPKVILLQKKTH